MILLWMTQFQHVASSERRADCRRADLSDLEGSAKLISTEKQLGSTRSHFSANRSQHCEKNCHISTITGEQIFCCVDRKADRNTPLLLAVPEPQNLHTELQHQDQHQDQLQTHNDLFYLSHKTII